MDEVAALPASAPPRYAECVRREREPDAAIVERLADLVDLVERDLRAFEASGFLERAHAIETLLLSEDRGNSRQPRFVDADETASDLLQAIRNMRESVEGEREDNVLPFMRRFGIGPRTRTPEDLEQNAWLRRQLEGLGKEEP